MKKNPPELESRDLSSTKEKNSQRLRKEVHVMWLCTTNMKKREGDVLSKQTQQSNNEEKQCLPVRCPTMSHQNKLSRATFYPFLDNKWQYMLPTLAFLVSHRTIKSKDDQFFWFLLLGFLLRNSSFTWIFFHINFATSWNSSLWDSSFFIELEFYFFTELEF